ncbi:DUF5367 domain-containing protein [uncultured Metabacillus sp.]|uniref:DUF5367 domain-containing protein n=1 Tax=uncultured Metabacillus sp. TaxID=2860135 RepID=UPI0026392248|nr:DUF5367 domain-containing protein [uncultured Metabacillus sp.]
MFFLFWGFFVWLGATLIFRFGGQFFFLYDQPLLMIMSYTLVVPLIAVLTLPVYKWKKVHSNQKIKAALFIALPGMLIDAVVLIYFQNLFPNLDPNTDKYFASWLLWAYSLILLSGFIEKQVEIGE